MNEPQKITDFCCARSVLFWMLYCLNIFCACCRDPPSPCLRGRHGPGAAVVNHRGVIMGGLLTDHVPVADWVPAVQGWGPLWHPGEVCAWGGYVWLGCWGSPRGELGLGSCSTGVTGTFTAGVNVF